MYFTEEERKAIIGSLSKSQRNALHVFSRLSKQSYFANVLASYKGTERFFFDGYVDHGGVKKGVTCLCGKSLRYEFILRDIKSGQKISLGRTHFQKELDIPDHIARQVHKGIHQINIELDEILDKIWRNDTKLPQSIVKHINEIELSEEIECLLNASLPLLRRHIDYLFDVSKKYRQQTSKTDKQEILGKEFQDVHDGTISYEQYIDELYGEAIEEYLLKAYGYNRISSIIEFLVKTKGLKNQTLNEQHALYSHFFHYLRKNPKFFAHKDDKTAFKHIVHMDQKERVERESAEKRKRSEENFERIREEKRKQESERLEARKQAREQAREQARKQAWEKIKADRMLRDMPKMILKNPIKSADQLKIGTIINHRDMGRGEILYIDGDVIEMRFSTEVKSFSIKLCLDRGLLELA
ncbi:hypothetical protein [Paenibacillus vini]|uniref:Uncharacterized protein n=1 Tax=Paenibacillus vini TaxID=1476024 RepID=A0ABQ4MAA8_9BACL|nr:hypothetical protein [Paenibacillus vini]GIP52921.1 hypothetical protein J42TS3_19560 [Paenibacillus vini]